MSSSNPGEQAKNKADIALPPDTKTPSLEAELKARSAVTSKVAEFGGCWEADDVAAFIIRKARAGRFTATPGWRLGLFNWTHSIIAPAFRAYQTWLVRRDRKSG